MADDLRPHMLLGLIVKSRAKRPGDSAAPSRARCSRDEEEAYEPPGLEEIPDGGTPENEPAEPGK